MRKIIKIALFITFMIIMPQILHGKEEEVKYKFYKEIEKNVHYESDPKHFCEYFETIDYNSYIYSNSHLSSTKPEEKEGRIITSYEGKVSLDKDYINSLKIEDMYSISPKTKLLEIEVYEKDGSKVDYKLVSFANIINVSYLNDGLYEEEVPVQFNSNYQIKFEQLHNIHDLTIKIIYKMNSAQNFTSSINGIVDSITTGYYYYDKYEYTLEECDGLICNITERLKEDKDETYDINSIIYEYKDPMYKCYVKEKLYVPGYYIDLEGFIKDEEDFKVFEKEESTNKQDFINEINLLKEENSSVINSLNKEILLLKENNNNNVNKLNDEITFLKKELNSFIDTNISLEEITNYFDSQKNDNVLLLDEMTNQSEMINYMINDIYNQNNNLLLSLNALSNKEEKSEEIIEDPIEEIIKDPIEETLSEESDVLAYENVTIKEPKPSKTSLFFTVFGVVSLILSSIIQIIFVKKCRTK